jgi:hypothetical protein
MFDFNAVAQQIQADAFRHGRDRVFMRRRRVI